MHKSSFGLIALFNAALCWSEKETQGLKKTDSKQVDHHLHIYSSLSLFKGFLLTSFFSVTKIYVEFIQTR